MFPWQGMIIDNNDDLKRSLGKIVEIVTTFLLVILPINNAYELIAFFSAGSANLTSYNGPIFLKIIKDIGLLLFILLYFCSITNPKGVMIVDINFLIISIFILFLFSVSLATNGGLIAAAGLRWIMPLFLIVVLKRFVSFILIRNVCVLLFYLTVLNFTIQIYELFYMPHWYGNNLFGLAGRVPGFFFLPNSAAFFISVSLVTIAYFDSSLIRRRVVYLIAPISVLITQSGTGIIAVACIILLRIFGRYRTVLIVVIPLLLPVILLNLNAITGRDGYLEISGGGRLEILLDILTGNLFSFGNFGLFTNTGVLITAAYSSVEASAMVADSFWAAVIGNCGVLGILIVVAAGLYVYNSLEAQGMHKVFPLLLIYFLFSLTTIVTEAYPMNFLFPILLWGAQLEMKTT